MAGELPQSIHSNEHVTSPETGGDGEKRHGAGEPLRASSSPIRNAFAEAASDEEDAQIDMAAAVDAEIFGNGTVRGMAWVQDAIRSRANFAQRLPGTAEMTIGSGPGSLANMTAEERKRKADEDSQEWFDTMLDMGERKRQQLEREQREREEWEDSVHSFAGQDLTGKEWAELAESLKKGSKGYDWLIDYMMQQGQTREQAEEMAKDMQLAASGMSKPEGDRTKEERDAMDRIERNPKAKKAYDATIEAQNRDFPMIASGNAIETRANLADSVSARADAFDSGEHAARIPPVTKPTVEEQQAIDRTASSPIGAVAMQDMVALRALPAEPKAPITDDSLFPSAPNLTEHHQAAVAATEPLDVKKPVQIAASPQPSASAGLDV